MKRFITLLLMVTTLLTFTQKVMAFAPLVESEIQSLNHCASNNMEMGTVACASDMVFMENCQSHCETVTVVSVIHFIENEALLSFNVSQLQYNKLSITATYHYSEPLYRPPFFS